MHATLTLAGLKESITKVHPDLIPVSPLLFQRIVTQHLLQTQGQRIRIPNREFFALQSEHLRKIVTADELGVPEDALPDEVLLIQRPNEDTLAAQPASEALYDMWRLSFQARAYNTLHKARLEGRLTQREIHQDIDGFGRGTFAEIRAILAQEDTLFPDPDFGEEYITFAAYFLQLTYFAPQLVSLTFPGIDHPEHVEELLKAHLSIQALLEQSKPEGAPSRENKLTRTIELFEEAPRRAGALAPEEEILAVERSPRINSLLEKGNYVRALLAARKHVQATEGESDDTDETTKSTHRDGPDVLDLTFRTMGLALHDAIGEEGPDAALWQHALSPLIEHIRFGFASSAGRLLYELQKLCQERKRELYKIDLVDWAFSLGRRPMKRDFSELREVLYCRYLRQALKMLARIQLNTWQHGRLKACLQEALQIAEERLRESLRPTFLSLFVRIKLSPKNLPEEIAKQKLVEELLDKVVNRGFFTMSELRDGIARSQLTLDDLHSPLEFMTGDTLLLADRILHTEHPGIYRRGEIYLRGLQRASSVFFGNFIGRALSLWLLLPMLASFVTLEGVQHLLHLLPQKMPGHSVKLFNNTSFLVLSLFFLGIINNATFRGYTIAGFKGLWHFIRFIFAKLPKKLAQLPLVIEFHKSAVYYVAVEYVAKPAFWTLFIALPLLFTALSWKTWYLIAGGTLVALSLFLNSPIGRSVHEFGLDHLIRMWHRIRYKILPGLIRWIIDFFKAILHSMDSVIYRVDEWLRFRTEASPLSVAFKAVFGVFWFFISYLVRIYITLLIEPQINPIKHFPVVTVSHKIILPMSKPLTLFLIALLQPFLGTILAGTLAATTVLLLPGVFGFLAWELKENWRLYDANRSPTLRPILIGSHGETMVRLLRPGFHSGTIPKLFSGLRHYERRLFAEGLVASKHKHQKELHHIEEDLKRFAQRELLILLKQSEHWTHPLKLGPTRISANHIRLQIKPEASPYDPITIHFEERSHYLLARLEEGDWLAALPPQEKQVFQVALAGLYKYSGVQMVHEEIEALLGLETRYDVTEDGLLVWPNGNYEHTFAYKLVDAETLSPIALDEQGPTTPSPLPAKALSFSERPITWEAWVAYWNAPSTENALFSDFGTIITKARPAPKG